ncbi:MAG: hypothetical protein ACTSRK_09365 [Promethearchaeota archaeon]
MIAKTEAIPNTDNQYSADVLWAPKEPDTLFNLKLLLFIGLERLIAYFSFIYSIL